MPKTKYKEFNFRYDSLVLIQKCETILQAYHKQGYDMTLRQLYYQLVSADEIPNKKESYDNLGVLVNNARLAGMLDWNMLVDRTRSLRGLAHYDSPESRIKLAAHNYHIDKWQTQKHRVEIWIEKEALAGVFDRVASELDVPYFSCKGYNSQSEMWRAAMRLQSYLKNGQTPVIIHFGDHDPSGIDMTRDIDDRIAMFMGGVDVQRLALNMPQVKKYNPPPNPAKITDSRAKVYIEKYGNESWELDALKPDTLAELVRTSILSVRDETAWQAACDEEKHHVRQLHTIADGFTKAQWFLGGNYPKPFYCGCPSDCDERVAIQGEISENCQSKCAKDNCYEMCYEDESTIFCYDHWKEARDVEDEDAETDYCTTDDCENEVSPDSSFYCDDCLEEQNSEDDE